MFRDGKTILFDYTDRDPLTNNARLTDITDEVNKNYGKCLIRKKEKVITAIIAVILVLAMVVPTVLSLIIY